LNFKTNNSENHLFLDVIGASSYVVMDTDYDTYGMVCTCQDMDLFFTFAHRRSCSILQRDPIEENSITEKMAALIDEEVNDASHDFDKIKQEGCDYDKEKVLNIDVDKILGLKGNSDVREEVDSVASEFEFTKGSLDDVKEEAIDLISTQFE